MEWITLIIVVAGFVYLLVSIFGSSEGESESEGMEIVCMNANCDYKGKPGFAKQRSNLVGVFLFLFWIVPGILYFVLVPEYKYWCPQCKMKLVM